LRSSPLGGLSAPAPGTARGVLPENLHGSGLTRTSRIRNKCPDTLQRPGKPRRVASTAAPRKSVTTRILSKVGQGCRRAPSDHRVRILVPPTSIVPVRSAIRETDAAVLGEQSRVRRLRGRAFACVVPGGRDCDSRRPNRGRPRGGAPVTLGASITSPWSALNRGCAALAVIVIDDVGECTRLQWIRAPSKGGWAVVWQSRRFESWGSRSKGPGTQATAHSTFNSPAWAVGRSP